MNSILFAKRARGKRLGSYEMLKVEIISTITNTETIAVGDAIRDIARLRKLYGVGRWRKMKGIALARLPDGTTCNAEVHWYEAHGIGRKEIKAKRLLDE